MEIDERRIKSAILSVLMESSRTTELNESRDHPPTPGASYPVQGNQEPGDVIRLVSGKYKIPAEDLNYHPNDRRVYYEPKRRSKAKRQVYSKPDGMSIKDYYSNIVLRVNPKLKAAEDMYDDEVWAPVRNVGRYFGRQTTVSTRCPTTRGSELSTLGMQQRAASLHRTQRRRGVPCSSIFSGTTGTAIPCTRAQT